MEMGKEAANYRVTIMFQLYVRYFMVIILFNPLNTLEEIDKQRFRKVKPIANILHIMFFEPRSDWLESLFLQLEHERVKRAVE